MKRILIADDEPDLLEIMEEAVSAEGREVVVVPDGPSALRELEDKPFDLVILDILMPEPNGLDIARRIRENPETEKMPILIVSAMSQQVTKEVASAIGIDEFIVKPFDFDELNAAVERLLE